MVEAYLWLLLFAAFVVGSMVGVLLYPRPSGSWGRFLLLVVVGIIVAFVLLYSPCLIAGGGGWHCDYLLNVPFNLSSQQRAIVSSSFSGLVKC